MLPASRCGRRGVRAVWAGKIDKPGRIGHNKPKFGGAASGSRVAAPGGTKRKR